VASPGAEKLVLKDTAWLKHPNAERYTDRSCSRMWVLAERQHGDITGDFIRRSTVDDTVFEAVLCASEPL
jgi:hypothetical protein